MPVIKCSNGKWKVGQSACIYDTHEQAALVWAAILAGDKLTQIDKTNLAEGMPHYTKDGILWTGETHKDSEGKLMTGAVHTADSEYLYHKEELK
jgi:hypothetical protein